MIAALHFAFLHRHPVVRWVIVGMLVAVWLGLMWTALGLLRELRRHDAP